MAAGVGLSLYSSANRDSVKVSTAAHPAASAKGEVTKPAPSAEPPRDVKRIEELPIAPPEPQMSLPPSADEATRRGMASRARPGVPAVRERRPGTSEGARPSATSSGNVSEPATGTPAKKVDRESLYGRD